VPSWHERERIPEPDPHLEAGGTIENAQHLGARKPTHHQTVRSHRRRDPLDKVERIANLISALQPHKLSVALLSRSDDAVPAATSIYRLSGLL